MQTNFTMSAEDDEEFFNMLLGREDTIVLSDRCHPTSRPMPTTVMPEFGPGRWIQLFNSSLKPGVELHRSPAPESPIYQPDMQTDAWMEVSRSYIEEGVLYPRRLYAYKSHMNKLTQTRAYALWYTSLASWIKRRYAREAGIPRWVGPGAQRWLAEGRQISPNSFYQEKPTFLDDVPA